MRVQPVTVNVVSQKYGKQSRNLTSSPQNINFQGTVGKIQGGLKGAMIGGLVWALGTMALPVLPIAAAIGAVAFGAIDSKLEDQVSEEENKKNKD